MQSEIEAARLAGREEALKVLAELTARLERQSTLRGHEDASQAPFDAHAVIGALRQVLGEE